MFCSVGFRQKAASRKQPNSMILRAVQPGVPEGTPVVEPQVHLLARPS